MTENNFGEIVKRERKKMEMSLAKVADAVTNINNDHKINPSYINRLEKGEQSNPSFVIVALLSSVLNLDIREVIRSFGFENLIEGYGSKSEFTLEELIRLNSLKFVDGSANDNEIATRLLNGNEKEALIKLLEAIFEYTSKESNSSIDKLLRVIEEIDKLRKIQQREFKEQETIEFSYMGTTFSIEMGSLPKREGIMLGKLREDIIKTIEKEFNKLQDLPSGIIKLEIGKERWIVQKEQYNLTLLSKQPGIIEL